MIYKLFKKELSTDYPNKEDQNNCDEQEYYGAI